MAIDSGFPARLVTVYYLSLFPIFLSGFGFVVSGVFPISLISSTGSYEHEHGIAILKGNLVQTGGGKSAV